jgi:DNA-binding Xre family transcriptional regulator
MEFELVTATIKQTLKRKKVTYAKLAEYLEMSESGVKKILNAKDANFTKLQAICNCLDVSLKDILEEVESTTFVEEKFSKEHEKFFFHNKNFFYFYWLLVVERRPKQEIQKQYNLTKRQLTTYLTKLDSLGLIELHPSDKIKLPPRQASRWVGSGPLTNLIQSTWGEELWKDCFEKSSSKDQYNNIRYLNLDSQSYEELVHRLQEIEVEFVARSTRNQKLSVQKTKPYRFMNALKSGSFVQKL